MIPFFICEMHIFLFIYMSDVSVNDKKKIRIRSNHRYVIIVKVVLQRVEHQTDIIFLMKVKIGE